MSIIVYNGKIILKDHITEEGYVEINNGIIENIGKSKPEKYIIDRADEKIDAKGMYISPGFIDIHTHGGGGYEFGMSDELSYIIPCETHAKHGTTSLYPTISSYTFDIMKNAIISYNKAKSITYKGATMRGLHFEGPYFAASQKGAQLEKYLRNPIESEYMEILDMSDDIKRWSGACELEGMENFAKVLKSRNILAAIGHSNATYDEVVKALKWGFSLVTHLYSGCSTIKREKGYRIPGVVEAAYLLDELDVEIICDGHHLPDSLIQFVYKFKGPEKTAVITDSLSFAGINAPNGTLLREDIFVEDGVAKLIDRSAFGGSIATYDMLIRTLMKARIPFLDIIKMSTITPARIMGIDKETGSLEKNKEADLIIFDEQINMHAVLVKGNRVL